MLKFIRRNASAVWVKMIFLTIVLVFVIGFGVSSYIRDSHTIEFAARVNGEAVPVGDFERAYDNVLRLYQDIYKENFKPELAAALDIKGKALDQVINTQLLRQEATRIGLRVGDDEVRDAVAQMSVFQDNGRFSRDLYVRVLRANSLTPGEFEESKADQLLVEKLQNIIVDGVLLDENEVHDRFRFDNERFDLRFIRLDGPQFIDQVAVTDEQAEAFYSKNQNDFREPERLRLEFVLYPPDRFADKVTVSDSDLEQDYATHQANYSTPEQVHARHILVKVAPDASDQIKTAARTKAQEIRAKALTGDFAELAKQYSEDPGSASQGGDLGTFPRGRMVKPFEDAAFSVTPGQISEVVETPFGFHIIKVDSKDEARTKPLSEVRAEVTASVKQERSRTLAREQATADQAKVASGTTLATVASASGLTVQTPSPVSRTDSLPGITGAPVIAAAFAGEVGKVAPVVDIPDGFVVLVVDEKLPAHVPPFAEIRDRVVNTVRTDQAQAMAKSKAEALLPEVQKSDIETVAKTAGLTVEDTGPFAQRGDYIPKIGSAPELKKAVFTLSAEKPVAPAVYDVSGSSVIAALKERIPADEEQYKMQKDNLVRQAGEVRKGQALEAFLNSLKASSTIEVSQEYLAGVQESGRPMSGRRRR